jgi:hypothetical protein
VSHVRSKRWIVGVVLLALVAGLLVLVLRPRAAGEEASADDVEPAQVEPVKGTDLSRVTLSADAARRLGIRTAAVERLGPRRTAMPYAAVLYDPEGRTFVYTSPETRVFVRHPITVRRIAGQRALLSSGPPVGTAVVTVGSQELFGTEYEVEED